MNFKWFFFVLQSWIFYANLVLSNLVSLVAHTSNVISATFSVSATFYRFKFKMIEFKRTRSLLKLCNVNEQWFGNVNLFVFFALHFIGYACFLFTFEIVLKKKKQIKSKSNGFWTKLVPWDFLRFFFVFLLLSFCFFVFVTLMKLFDLIQKSRNTHGIHNNNNNIMKTILWMIYTQTHSRK